MTSIQLLGGATIRCNGAPLTGPPSQRHRLALLALLAGSWPQALARDRAMALLWPEHDSDRARRLLNLAVHVLRRALGETAIVSAGDVLLFEPAHAACDLHAFRAAVAAGDHDAAAQAYAGPFLDGFHLPDAPEFEYWLDARRSEFAHEHEGALLTLSDRQRLAGDVHAHVGTCRRLVAADPWSGPHARALMLALEAAGDRAGAIRHAHDHARRVQADLDMQPDAETLALAQRMQAGAEPAVDRRDVANALPIQHASHVVAVMAADETADEMRDAELDADLRDRIIGRLLRAPNVRVAALAGASMRLLAAAPDRPAADAVVETRVLSIGERVRIRLRVVDAADGVFLVSTRFEQAATALDTLVEEAADAVIRALSARPLPNAARVVSDYDVEEARMLCAKGQYFCARRGETELHKAIACFERARALAPSYAPAYTGLASAYAILGFYDLMAPREAFSLAKQAARTARALNPADPDCHASLGYIAKYFDWHWRSAEQELQNAIALNPSSAIAHQWYGNYFVLRGRSDDAITCMKRAVQLAPESAIATAATGWAHYFAGDHERAIDYCRAGSDIDPHLPMAHAWLGQTLEEMGRYDEAIAALRTAASLSSTSGAVEAALAHAIAKAGGHDEARDILRRLAARRRTGYVPSYEVAKVHLALGDSARTIRMLETAYRERSHSMGILRVDPQLRPLHDSPRFQQLVARVGHT